MPKRQSHTKKVISTELQGDDSWVIIDMPTVEQARKMDDQLKAFTRQVELAEYKVKSLAQAQLENYADAVDDYTNAINELAIAQETLGDFSLSILSNYVKEWNWVDDDGNPLPQPHEDGVSDKLYMNEFKWLMGQVIGVDETKKKNGRR